MKRFQPVLALTFLLLFAGSAAAAESAAAPAAAAASAVTATVTVDLTASRQPADCAAKAPFASTALDGGTSYCDDCSHLVCRGKPVGEICGLSPFGEIQVCQDQLVSCINRTYPESIYCRCTSDIVP